MDCPKCGKQTITFAHWKKARNAFQWICPHCSAELKGNKMVVLPFVIALVLMIAIVTVLLFALPPDLFDSKSIRKFVAFGAALAIGAPLAALSWFKGGYVEK